MGCCSCILRNFIQLHLYSAPTRVHGGCTALADCSGLRCIVFIPGGFSGRWRLAQQQGELYEPLFARFHKLQ